MLLDKIYGMRGNGIGDVFVFPKSLASPFHITDTSYTVHDCHVMTVTGFQIIE